MLKFSETVEHTQLQARGLVIGMLRELGYGAEEIAALGPAGRWGSPEVIRERGRFPDCIRATKLSR
ncbi:MAG TPA: hypothetical protein VLF16_13930 [Pseudomonas sp.]|nr:hypothetical protein [Pseudomonas sp.]